MRWSELAELDVAAWSKNSDERTRESKNSDHMTALHEEEEDHTKALKRVPEQAPHKAGHTHTHARTRSDADNKGKRARQCKALGSLIFVF